MIYGYARVSTIDQDLSIQHAALTAAGCTVVRSEKVTGTSTEGRQELATLLQFLREGDTLVVTRIDRLARSLRDLQNIVHDLRQRGVTLKATPMRPSERWNERDRVTESDNHSERYGVHHALTGQWPFLCVCYRACRRNRSSAFAHRPRKPKFFHRLDRGLMFRTCSASSPNSKPICGATARWRALRGRRPTALMPARDGPLR
jgi:hypothetical protein